MNKWLTGIVTAGGIWSIFATGAIAQTPSYEEIDAMSCPEYQQVGDREGRDFFGQIYNQQGEDAAMLWLSKGGNCVLETIEETVPAAPPVPTRVDLEQMPCDDIKAILTDGSTVARWDFGAEWELWLERYEACEPGSVIRLESRLRMPFEQSSTDLWLGNNSV